MGGCTGAAGADDTERLIDELLWVGGMGMVLDELQPSSSLAPLPGLTQATHHCQQEHLQAVGGGSAGQCVSASAPAAHSGMSEQLQWLQYQLITGKGQQEALAGELGGLQQRPPVYHVHASAVVAASGATAAAAPPSAAVAAASAAAGHILDGGQSQGSPGNFLHGRILEEGKDKQHGLERGPEHGSVQGGHRQQQQQQAMQAQQLAAEQVGDMRPPTHAQIEPSGARGCAWQQQQLLCLLGMGDTTMAAKKAGFQRRSLAELEQQLRVQNSLLKSVGAAGGGGQGQHHQQ